MELAFNKSCEDCCKYFDVNEASGLTEDQIKKNTEKYGPNGKY